MLHLEWSDLLSLGSKDLRFRISEKALENVNNSYYKYKELLATEKVYGTHTGFGHNVQTTVQNSHWENHQKGLIQFLHVGRGSYFSDSVVRRALRLQVLKLSWGHSGIHPETFLDLLELSNSLSLPQVPCYGSLGASGDLIPMSHATAPLFERGAPRGERDALALVNTNSMMCSLSLDCFLNAQKIIDLSIKSTANTSLALRVSNDFFNVEFLNAGLVDQQEIIEASKKIMSFRENFLLTENRKNSSNNIQLVEPPLQERYSVRCSPQVFGAALQDLADAQKRIREESLSVADNPLVLEKISHGGRFYTARLASACDLMTNAIYKCVEMLDRQVHLLVTPEFSHGLPANLQISSDDHVKGLHQLISSLLQQSRTYLLPSALLAAPAESYNQDIVPATMAKLNNLQAMQEVLHTAVKASLFVTERASLMAHGFSVPERLTLAEWKRNAK